MSNTQERASLNKRFETVNWGLFFIGIGAIWAVQSVYRIDIKGGVFILIGALLIGLNALRRLRQIQVSKFTLFIGIVLLLVGISDLGGLRLPVFETVLILIGLFIVLGAFSRKRAESN